jgi:putative FmdB family regulatory protein
MPTYIYRRADGTTFECQQRMSEDALTECPTTGQPVHRVISGQAGVVFKGSGFYETDYVRKPGSKTSGTESKETPSTPSSSTEASKSTTTPTPASD